MTHKDHNRRSDCPCSCALDILGDKWTLLVLRDAALRMKSTYGEFLASEEHISTNILADRLMRMVREGIFRKNVHHSDKRKDRYILTAKGLDLIPLCIEFFHWGAKYGDNTNAPKSFAKSTPREREKMSQQIRKEYQKCIDQTQ